MKKTIVVVGATGNLGVKIINALLAKEADVKAIVRLETDIKKINELEKKGVTVYQVDFNNKSEISKHCIGAHCVVSALAGLRKTVVDTQKIVLNAAIEANVRRFIPSDYSIDFTNLIEGQNRNLDLRKEFHHYLDKAPIKATSIFNGAFMDLLTTDMPLIMFKLKRILCWGNPNQIMEFTTTYNVAEYTAEVALDEDSPRYLRIAGDRLSCNQFAKLLTELTGKKYKIFRPGGIKLLNILIKITRFFSPSKKDLYPAWQGMQYMRDMMEGRVVFQKYDNDRYSKIKWTSIKEFLNLEEVNLK
ncbi:NmrA family protein [Solitalea longa]|uniref:NmrA family protein n=1 Tax=Solitalea longa TaxID=2079460 RepID=A0A2S5ABA1_9SPHI|nr:NmrA family NAD(P)-binding protein [Solitalea longa]POY39383.1 NmrA family protein [Solitalea longa]